MDECQQALRAMTAWAHCLTLLLDEIDHGLLLLDADGYRLLANRRARDELDGLHPVVVTEEGRVRGRGPGDAAALSAALQAAQRCQQREMLTLGDGDQRVAVAVVPLADGALDSAGATLLVLGRLAVGGAPAVQGFAQAHGLTPAETSVLEALCAGVPPRLFAQRKGVRLSTVRTQIGCVRDKTGAHSIRALMRMVAVLPPMVPARRPGAGRSQQQ